MMDKDRDERTVVRWEKGGGDGGRGREDGEDVQYEGTVAGFARRHCENTRN